MNSTSQHLQRAVVLGGGAVGAMLAGLLDDAGVDVTVVDHTESVSAPPAVTCCRNDATALSEQGRTAVAEADLVVLALPESAALSALSSVVELLGAHATLADTLSVKHRIVAAYRGHPRVEQVVSINPMFAPSLGISGRPVLRATLRPGSGVSTLADLLAQAGAVDVEIDPDQHDIFTAAVQCLPHAATMAYGLALSRVGVDPGLLEAAQPPPSTTMHALAARILTGSPEVYHDIQRGNPHAAEMRSALAAALRELTDVIESSHANDTDPTSFTTVLNEAATSLTKSLETGQKRCQEIFQNLHM